jgi:hypothetical protein
MHVNYAHKRLTLLTKKGLAAVENCKNLRRRTSLRVIDRGEDVGVLEKRDADKNYDPFGDEPKIC